MKDQTANSIDDITSGFLDFLKKNEFYHLLPEIVHKLSLVVAEREQTGELVSVVKLTPEQINKAEEMLSRKLNTTVRLVNRIDPSILGGLVIRYKDMVIDQSVAGKLGKLTKKLYETT